MSIEQGMLISYDPEIDALFIGLSRTRPVDSREISEGVTLDVDEHGAPVSLEILDVTECLGEDALKQLIVEGLTTIVRPGEPAETVIYSHTSETMFDIPIPGEPPSASTGKG